MTTESVKEAEVKETVEQVAETSTAEVQNEAPKSEAQKEAVKTDTPKKEKKYVPLDELISERQRRREADKKLRELEDRVNKLSAEDPVKKIATDLNVDEDTARKLYTHFGSKAQSVPHSAEDSLKAEFQAKCEDYAVANEDWFEHKDEMEKLFSQDVDRLGLANALRNDPEKYYLKAKLLRRQDPEKARQAGAKEVVEKLNQQSMATTESAKNSAPKPTGGPKWTREKIAELHRSGEYSKYRDEILKAAQAGQIH